MKKFVTAFLLLATVAASSLFLFTGASSPSAPRADLDDEPRGSPPANAFAESLPAPAAPQTPRHISEPNSLTERLAMIIAEQVVAANPDGPTAENGVVGASVPDMRSAVTALTSDPVLIARLRADAARDDVRIPGTVIADDYTEDDMTSYAQSYASALRYHLFDDLLMAKLDATPSHETARAIASSLGGALEEISALHAPRPLGGLHRATVEALARAQDLTRIMDERGDPLEGVVGYQLRMERAERAFALMADEADKVNGRRAAPAAADAHGAAEWVRGLLGIPTAHAQVIPIDCIGPVCAAQLAGAASTAKSTTLTLAQRILQFLKKLALEFLKDHLIHRLVQQTIQWIQGSGKPQFITDWKGFLGDAANAAIGNALYDIDPQLCTSFGPLIRVAMMPVNPAADRPVLCTLTQVIGNVRAFADDFANGGWVAYGAALEPQNNFFGALIQTSDMWNREARTAADAAKSDAESSEGWLSTRVCSKFGDFIPDDCANLATCKPVRKCKEWITTTPGAALGYNIYNALGSPVHRIVNADDVGALVSALINAGLQKLIDVARGGSTGTTYSSENPGISGIDVTTIGPPATAAPDFTACYNVGDARAQQDCINTICQSTGWAQPPCTGAPVPPRSPPPPGP